MRFKVSVGEDGQTVLAYHPKVSEFVRKAADRALSTFPTPFRKILEQPGRKFWFLPIEGSPRVPLAEAKPDYFKITYNPHWLESLPKEDAAAMLAQEMDHLLRPDLGFPGGEYYTKPVPIPRNILGKVYAKGLDPTTKHYLDESPQYATSKQKHMEILGMVAEQAARKERELVNWPDGPKRGKGLLPEWLDKMLEAREKQAEEVAEELEVRSRGYFGNLSGQGRSRN